MARKTGLAAVLLFGFVASCIASSPLTLKFQPDTEDGYTGSTVLKAVNKDIKSGKIGPPEFDASLFKVTLPPCAVRATHIHDGVHEMHYVIKGNFLAGNKLKDGRIITDKLSVGDTFISPKNTVHALMNPSCNADASFLAFYTHVTPETHAVPQGANLFTFDEDCVKRCRLASQPHCKYDYSKTSTKYSGYWK